jgi:nitrogen fixation protein NifX
MDIMTTPAISREVALRIGLAAKALSNVSPRDLLLILVETLGKALTEDDLRRITETDLRAALESVAREEDREDALQNKEAIKLAVRYLWGEETGLPGLPQVHAYAEGDMPGSIRIAIASSSEEKVDGHFGSCLRYLIYQLSTEEYRLIDIRSAAGAENSDDKNAFRVNLVKDCHIIFFQSVGGPAAAKIVKAGVYPIKKPDGGSANETLEELQQVMKGTPPPWLAKAMGRDASKELKFSEENE